MTEISIYTLTSDLHDEQAVDKSTKEFLGSLDIDYVFKGNDYSDFGSHLLDLIFVRTGGTEGIFHSLLCHLDIRSGHPFYLLTSGKSNSLAASMEILSFLRQNGMKGEIIHGSPEYVSHRITTLLKVNKAVNVLKGIRLGIIGRPSDWLIASGYDTEKISNTLGVHLCDIDMSELLAEIKNTPLEPSDLSSDVPCISKSLPGAQQIYKALKVLVDRYQLHGLTIRCFDLLSTVKNTGCLALAKLNAEGVVAGCEGDVPTMLTMTLVRALTGFSSFQANPSRINPETGEIIFAHCTVPLDIVNYYELATHFESGIGIGIRGKFSEGGVTIFKVSGDLSRMFVAEGTLTSNLSKPDLCRTQINVRLDNPSHISYFLTDPISNHHVIVPGKHKKEIMDFLNMIMN